ncbi:MAG: hypothetical protein QMC80_04020 [Thermoplasmatales archaeon]|nr:hypothetical protein [Thermoplasmatales archaeon]
MTCKWENERELCTNNNAKYYYFLCIRCMNLECKHYEKNRINNTEG